LLASFLCLCTGQPSLRGSSSMPSACHWYYQHILESRNLHFLCG
jgi:hypothetical protein